MGPLKLSAYKTIVTIFYFEQSISGDF